MLHILAGHLLTKATIAVTGGIVADRVYKNYSRRQARLRNLAPHPDGMLVEAGDDEFWVSRADMQPFQGISPGQLFRYRVSPLRHDGFKIGWIEPVL